MADFLTALPLFSIVLTCGAFQIGAWCQKKTKSPLCNPILVGAILVIAVLLLTGIDPEVYEQNTQAISWLLTPATVCLAVPLHRQLKILKKNLPAILTGIVAGSVAGLVAILLMCKLFALDRTLSVSLLPKSITTAIGMVLSEQNGGNAALTSVVIIITGVFGNLIGSTLCKILKLDDPISQGVAFGTASHLGGTSKATELGSLTGAVSSLSLVVAGILTTVLFPFVLKFL